MNRKQSKDLIIGLYRINQICFSSHDYKKYMLKNEYSRLSHFHKSTR